MTELLDRQLPPESPAPPGHQPRGDGGAPTPPARGKSKWWMYGLAVIGAVLVLIPFILTPVANYFIRKNLTPALELSKLRFNPMTGNLEISIPGDERVTLHNYRLEWDWLPLFHNTVRINQIALSGLAVDVERFEDGSIRIGATRFKPTEEALVDRGKTVQDTGKPMTIEVRDVRLDNIRIRYKDSERQANLSLAELHLLPKPGSFFRFKLSADLTRDIDFSGDLRLDKLEMQIPRTDVPAKGESASTDQKLQGLSLTFSGLGKAEDLHLRLTPNKKTQAMDLAYRWKNFEITEESSFDLAGQGFRSPLKFSLKPFWIGVKDIDTEKPDQQTTIAFKTRTSPDSEIDYYITGQPLLTPSTLAGKGRIRNVDLPPLSALAERFIGYQITAGKLKTDSTIRVANGRLDSKIDLTLNRLELQALKKEEADPLSESLGVPLGTGLMLLQDKNGDIQLAIPIQGDVNDPKVGLGDVYKTLLAKGGIMAAKSAISTAFPPFKVAGWVSSGVGMATKLRFDDLAFAPAGNQISQESTTYLTEVGGLLTKRPGVRIKITGFGTLADLQSPPQAGVTLNDLPEADRSQVLKLATARADAIKNYFVNTFSINPERLFVGSPQFDGKPGKTPRAEISL